MSLQLFRCPKCGATREALRGSTVAHPCRMVRQQKGRSRFVELVPVDEDAA